MPLVKTFPEACKALKIKATALPVVTGLPVKHRMSLLAYYKLIIIIQALNDGWEPDWSNTNEYKYYNWFTVKADKKHKAGVGFSYSDCVSWLSDTCVGSRLCFKTSELAEYARKHFIELYIDYLLLK